MRVSKGLTKVMAVLLMMTLVIGAVGEKRASAENSYLVQENPNGNFDINIEPGERKHFSVPIKVDTPIWSLVLRSFSAQASSEDIKVSNVHITNVPVYTGQEVVSVGSLQSDTKYNLEFDLTASDALKIGYNTFSIYGTGIVQMFGEGEEQLVNTHLITLTTYTATEFKPIEIVVDKVVYNEEDVLPGNKFTMKLTLKNTGERQALNTYLNMDFGGSGIIPDYKVESIKVGGIQAGKTVTVDVPVQVLKNAEPGFYSISAGINCKDVAGNAAGPFSQTLYITVNKPENKPVVTGTPSVVISTKENYKVLKPDSEENLKVTVKNSGTANAEDVRINIISGLDLSIGLTKAYTSEGIEVGTLKAGEEKEVTIPIKVSAGFAAGIYELQMVASFKDTEKNEKTSGTMTMYVKGKEKKVEEDLSSLSISTEDNYKILKPETSDVIKVTVKNTGKSDVKDAKVNVISGLDASVGITKGYTSDGISVGALKVGAQKTVEIPIRVSKNFSAGLFEIQMQASYKNKDNLEKTSAMLTMYVKGIEKEKEEEKKVISNVVITTEDNYMLLTPGTKTNIRVTVKNKGKTDVSDVKVVVLSGLDTSFGLTKGYTTEGISVGKLKAGEEKTVKIPIIVAKTFNILLNEIQMAAHYKDMAEADQTSGTMTMYVKGPEPEKEKEKEIERSSVSIGNVSQDPEEPKAGETVTVSFDIVNEGTSAITNVKVAGSGLSSSSFEPVSSDPYKSAGSIPAGSKKRVTMTFKVGKDIPQGFNTLNVVCEYMDSNGVTGSESAGLYILNVINEAMGENGEEKTSRPKLIISSYTAEPILTEEDLAADNEDDFDLDSGFDSDYDPDMDGGMQIYKGAGAYGDYEVEESYDQAVYGAMETYGDYSDADGFGNDGEYGDMPEMYPDGEDDPDLGADTGMDSITDDGTDDPEKIKAQPSKELKAGREFDFKYILKNTHAFKAAKNIKITIEQVEGVFIPVEGANIFYIDSIGPGEDCEQIIRMKTRSDVATGDYNISIKVEYEYDDMSAVDRERGGVVDDNSIKLRAVENYRPEIENISVDAYEGIRVGSPVDLNFEFYNMGKSTLGNVYVTIEGDFELANGSSKSYIGAVNGYSQEFVNPQVVPLTSGPATGIIVVHFEDSNGDEQIKKAKFSAYVMDEEGGGDYIPDWGDMSGGYYNPDFPDDYDPDMDPDAMDGEDSGKIIGLPVWLFITLCSVLGVAVIVVIIVVVVKKKRKKALLDEDDE